MKRAIIGFMVATILASAIVVADEFKRMLKTRNPVDLIEITYIDGRAYIHYPAQIRSIGSDEWTPVTVSVSIDVWQSIHDEIERNGQ